MEVTRRNCLSQAGNALLTGALTAGALAAGAHSSPAAADEGKNPGDTLYAHGMVWNRDLPGAASEVNLSFDFRADLRSGKGFGTALDPVHPDWNFEFAINSTQRIKLPRGESRFVMIGVVTEAANPSNVGLPVFIVADTVGDTTAIGIGLGDLTFVGAGLVVIAIIAILIGLLVPAVQKVREAAAR